MSFNWTNAFNRLMSIFDDRELGTYHSGSDFLNVVRDFSYDIPDYMQLIKERNTTGKSTTRKDYYKDILNDFPEYERIKIYRVFADIFKTKVPEAQKINEFVSYIAGFQHEETNVPIPDFNSDVWNAERLKKYLEKLEKALQDQNYEYVVTLAYTCLEGVYKTFIAEKLPEKSNMNDLLPMAKSVKGYIIEQSSENYPTQLINLITTMTNAVANARNSFSDSHFDKDAEASIAQFCRDCVNSIAGYVRFFMV